MEQKNDRLLNKLYSLTSRENVYGFAFLMGIILVTLSIFVPDTSRAISTFFDNKYWLVVIIPIYELFRQSVEKRISKENDEKIKSVGAILRTSQKSNLIDERVNRLLLEALNGDDLIKKAISDSELKELEEKTKKAGKTIKKTENIESF